MTVRKLYTVKEMTMNIPMIVIVAVYMLGVLSAIMIWRLMDVIEDILYGDR